MPTALPTGGCPRLCPRENGVHVSGNRRQSSSRAASARWRSLRRNVDVQTVSSRGRLRFASAPLRRNSPRVSRRRHPVTVRPPGLLPPWIIAPSRHGGIPAFAELVWNRRRRRFGTEFRYGIPVSSNPMDSTWTEPRCGVHGQESPKAIHRQSNPSGLTRAFHVAPLASNRRFDCSPA